MVLAKVDKGTVFHAMVEFLAGKAFNVRLNAIKLDFVLHLTVFLLVSRKFAQH
jgi:hypothetical protein